jgi:hypothetical protein
MPQIGVLLAREKGVDQQQQQPAADLSARPDRAIEHAVIVLKVALIAEPCHPQDSSTRTCCHTRSEKTGANAASKV